MTSAFHPIPTMWWTCLACERQNRASAIRCLGCGRSAAVATNHAIWDKYPPRTYLTVDAVIAPAPAVGTPLREHANEDPEDPCADGHEPHVEDIADGVVGGGAAHVYRTYCTNCDEELEPEEPDDD